MDKNSIRINKIDWLKVLFWFVAAVAMMLFAAYASGVHATQIEPASVQIIGKPSSRHIDCQVNGQFAYDVISARDSGVSKEDLVKMANDQAIKAGHPQSYLATINEIIENIWPLEATAKQIADAVYRLCMK